MSKHVKILVYNTPGKVYYLSFLSPLTIYMVLVSIFNLIFQHGTYIYLLIVPSLCVRKKEKASASSKKFIALISNGNYELEFSSVNIFYMIEHSVLGGAHDYFSPFNFSKITRFSPFITHDCPPSSLSNNLTCTQRKVCQNCGFDLVLGGLNRLHQILFRFFCFLFRNQFLSFHNTIWYCILVQRNIQKIIK